MRLENPHTVHHGDGRLLSIDFHPFCNIFVTSGCDEKFDEDSNSELEQGFIKVIVAL
jgi:hypothetical protein